MLQGGEGVSCQVHKKSTSLARQKANGSIRETALEAICESSDANRVYGITSETVIFN